MIIDTHMHTIYSGHSRTSLQTFRKICLKKNIIPCITDHDTIKGALLYKEKYKDCIIGEEITTKQGEVIALFLNKEIPHGLDVFETLDLIKQQGAISYIAHPFDSLRKKRMQESYLPKIKFDILEVFNGRNVFSEDNKKALDFADKYNIIKGVGSDAHTSFEIGSTYTIIDNFNSEKEFLKNIKKAQFVTHKSSILVHVITKSLKYLMRMGIVKPIPSTPITQYQ